MIRRKLPQVIERPFPYTKEYTSMEQLIKYFVEVMTRKNELYKTEDSRIPVYDISGYIVSPLRVTCLRVDENISPYEYFIANHKDLISSSNKNPRVLDELIWKEVKGCGAFPLQWAVYMMNYYKPKTVLDPCSGWGDRLLGALLTDVEYYCGVDPHVPLKYYYLRMLELFPNTKLRTKFVQKPFEDVMMDEVEPRKDKKFDMIITSPPYSTLEQYGDKDERSDEVWKYKFLYPMLTKAWEFTNKGGVMIIFMPREDVTYVADMVKYMKTITPTEVIRHQLGPSNAYIWSKKVGETMSKSDIIVKIDRKEHIICTGEPSFSQRATSRYLHMFASDVLHYVAIGKDQAASDLINETHYPKKIIKIYCAKDNLNYFTKLIKQRSKEAKSKIVVETYEVDYVKALREVKENATRENEDLLPTGFAGAEYDSCMIEVVVESSLYDMNDEEFKIFMFDTTTSIAKAFITLFPKITVVLCMPHDRYKNEAVPGKLKIDIISTRKEFKEYFETNKNENDYMFINGKC